MKCQNAGAAPLPLCITGPLCHPAAAIRHAGSGGRASRQTASTQARNVYKATRRGSSNSS